LAQDFQALGSALESGNLAGAQQAFSQLTADAQSASSGHRHHRTESSGGNTFAQLLQAVLASQSQSSASSTSAASASASTLNLSA
jgi:hypothetical protein